jgi:outer membrane autotransporter protein
MWVSEPEKTFSFASAPEMMFEGRAAWIHEFSPLTSVAMRFFGDTTTGFDLFSPEQARNSAVLGASLAVNGSRNFQFLANVGGEVSGATKGWTGDIGIRARW